MSMPNLIRLLQDDQGATAVEYGLIVAAIAGLIIAIVFVLGEQDQQHLQQHSVLDSVAPGLPSTHGQRGWPPAET